MAWPLARCGFIPQFLPAETGTSPWLPPRALSSSLTFKTSKGVRYRRAAPVVVASIHHPCGARGVADFPLAPAVNVASLCAGASIGETVSKIFLTRCFSPVHEGPRVSPHMLGQLLFVFCFVFLCRPLAVSFRGPLSVRPVHLLHPFSFPSLAPAEVPPFRVL